MCVCVCVFLLRETRSNNFPSAVSSVHMSPEAPKGGASYMLRGAYTGNRRAVCMPNPCKTLRKHKKQLDRPEPDRLEPDRLEPDRPTRPTGTGPTRSRPTSEPDRPEPDRPTRLDRTRGFPSRIMDHAPCFGMNGHPRRDLDAILRLPRSKYV